VLCRLQDTGRGDEALAALRALMAGTRVDPAALDTRTVASFCEGVRELQRQCDEFDRVGPSAFIADAATLRGLSAEELERVKEHYRVLCGALRP
jgi:hypothetical protein